MPPENNQDISNSNTQSNILSDKKAKTPKPDKKGLWDMTFNATTFSGYEMATALRSKYNNLEKLFSQFINLLDNIYYSDNPDLKTPESVDIAIKLLITEFQTRLNLISTEEENAETIEDEMIEYNKDSSIENPESMQVVLKSGPDVSILKSKEGGKYLLGRMTNAFYDRDNEVLTKEAHLKYLDWLDMYPAFAPQLWDWHIPATARRSKAIWWAYNDTDDSVYVMWPLTDTEATQIENTAKSYTLGMSHGFYVLDKDTNTGKIKNYITFEGSILPVEYAANPYTGVEIMNKGFSPDKREFLKNMYGDEYVSSLEAQAEKNKQSVLSEGLAPIQKSDDGNQTDTTEVTQSDEVESVSDVEPKTEAEVTSDINQTILSTLQALQAEVSSLSKELNTVKEAKAAQPVDFNQMSRAQLIAGITNKTSTIPDITAKHVLKEIEASGGNGNGGIRLNRFNDSEVE